MTKIIQLFKPKTKKKKFKKEHSDYHITGGAKCLHCNNEWNAVAPIGTTQLECPKCETEFGVFKYPIEPRAEEIWTCSCGSTLFYILDEGHQCYQCGTIQEYD